MITEHDDATTCIEKCTVTQLCGSRVIEMVFLPLRKLMKQQPSSDTVPVDIYRVYWSMKPLLLW